MKNFIRTILIYIRYRIYKERKFHITLSVTNKATKTLEKYTEFVVYAQSREGAYIKTEASHGNEFRHADHITIDEKIF